MTTTTSPAPSASARAPASRKSRLYRREHLFAAIFVAIPTLGFAAFVIGPFVFSLYVSFTNWNMLSSPRWIGIANYARVFQDPYFITSLSNTFFYMIGIPIGLVLSLLLAMAMNRRMPGRAVFRSIYYIPVVSSLAAVSILWQWAYNGDFGLVNQALALIGIDGPNWLQNSATVKPALIIMAVWKGLGFSMILYLAALQSVPATLYEAARIDGANSWQNFWYITLPMLRPVTFFLVVTGIIGGSQIYTEINIMTPNGGPEFSSASIVWYIWRQAFNNLQMGYAAAMAVVLAAIIFVITALQFWINARRSHDGVE